MTKMPKPEEWRGIGSAKWAVAFCLVSTLSAAFYTGCHSGGPPTIAVIPRTSGIFLWEAAHVGAELAAHSTGTKVYWNAPTREDDVQGQIGLVEKVVDRGYEGIVLAPDQALALITPVRRALSKKIPTVIIGSPLPIPAGGNLSYILTDDEEAGRMAAIRVARLLNGKGSVAILGIDPDISGIMIRERSLERALAQAYPQIRIVEKRLGSFNASYDQQIAEETLRENPGLKVIVALTSTSTYASCSAIDRSGGSARVVGFDDPDTPLWLHSARLDSVIIQNSREMGFEAIKTIAAEIQGRSVPAMVKLKPMLITLDNLQSPEVQEMLSATWRTNQ